MAKVQKGYSPLNVLVNLDALKVSKSKSKEFIQVIYSSLQRGYRKRYFDMSQLDEAFDFVAPNT